LLFKHRITTSIDIQCIVTVTAEQLERIVKNSQLLYDATPNNTHCTKCHLSPSRNITRHSYLAGTDPRVGRVGASAPLFPEGISEGKSLKLLPPDVKFYG